jgi:hypothetical protein
MFSCVLRWGRFAHFAVYGVLAVLHGCEPASWCYVVLAVFSLTGHGQPQKRRPRARR